MKLKSLKMPIKARIKKLISLSVFLVNAVSIHAQIQIEVTTKEARCSADGRIIVKASGGTAPYTYALGVLRPPQSNDTFDLLPSGLYFVRVVDNNGLSNFVYTNVMGNYREPSIQCAVNQSTVTLTPTGGRAPLRYTYSAYGTGNFAPPQSSNIFDCIPNGTHTFRIIDSCGNFFSMPCTVNMLPLRNTTTCKQVNGKTTLTTTAFSGGEPPYLFTCITNSNDTFRNTTGNFADLTGCNFTLIFSDKCNRQVQVFDCGTVEAYVRCANFKDRTASIYAVGGSPPYRYRSLDTTNVSPNGQFTNLPKNRAIYNFEVSDTCGHTKVISVSSMDLYDVVGAKNCPYTGTIFVKIKQVITEPDSCGKNCSSFYPYRLDCIDCVPPRSFVDGGVVGENTSIHTVDVSPLPQGTFHFNVFNGCGDSTQITVVTKKMSPPLRTSFNCKTNLISATTDLNGTIYILRDSSQRILATNTTGIFNSPYSGGFYVNAIYADCDTATRFLTTRIPKTAVCFGMSSKLNAAGQCDFKWIITASAFEATSYRLTDATGLNLTNATGIFRDMEPNTTYILKSDCATDTIQTPAALVPNLTATVFTNCTGRSAVQIRGARSQVGCLQNARDKYLIYDNQGVLIHTSQTGYYDSLKIGETYQIKLQNPEGCVLQTITIKAAAYQRPDLIATYGGVCGNQTTANIRAILRGGTPPFTFQITSPAGIRLPINTSDSAVIFNNLPVGNYVLRAFDACGVSSDYATSVGNFQFTPTSKRLCNGTLILEVPFIDSAIYKWTNGAGVTIGTNRTVELKDTTAQTYTITISTPQPCNFTNTITIPRFSTVRINVNAGVDFNSATSTATLNATVLGQGFTGRWRQIAPSTSSVTFGNAGSANSTVTVNTYPGTYTFVWEVTDNVNGCTVSDTVTGLFCTKDSLHTISVSLGYIVNCKLLYRTQVTVLKLRLLQTPLDFTSSFYYLWSNGGTSAVADSLSPGGTYSVTITPISNISCNLPIVASFTMPPLAPLPSRTIDTTLCAGFSLKVGTKSYTTAGNYRDTVLSVAGCDSIIVNSSVKIARVPIENLNILHDLMAKYCGDSLALNSKGDTASKYQWMWQNVSCPTCQNPKILPLSTPIYYVSVTDKTTKCTARDSVKVQIEGDFSERVPNAFTPNNDGLNDVFNVIPDNCIKIVRRLRIYNRWGNVVFDKPDLSPQKKQGWDGLLNNNAMAMDVYVYILELEFVDGTTKKISGEVNLIH
jgi:gliding motility-associated-like protein